MAYQESIIAALSDIPPLVSSFAALQGWTVDNTTPAEPIFTHPTLVGAVPHKLRIRISGTNNQNQDVIWEPQGVAGMAVAACRSPKLPNTLTNPLIATPTKLHTFCSLLPEPFIALVVEYGFNLYRHLYFGYPEKVGSYDGGELISGTLLYSLENSPGSAIDYGDRNKNKYLFQGFSTASAPLLTEDSLCGGMRCEHANNPQPYRKFNDQYSGVTPLSAMPSDCIIGGFRDSINEGYLARVESSYAGANILVPINLYATEPITSDTLFVPLGHPAGIRTVHMQDVEPGAQIDIAGDNWRCFPASAKYDFVTAVNGPSGQGFWPTQQTSYYVGYAYPEG